MTGFNLPPGVNVSDIPGNRPEDLKEEAFWDALDKKFAEEHPELWKIIKELYEKDGVDDAIGMYVIIARDLAYNDGYASGEGDAAMAHAQEQFEKAEKEQDV